MAMAMSKAKRRVSTAERQPSERSVKTVSSCFRPVKFHVAYRVNSHLILAWGKAQRANFTGREERVCQIPIQVFAFRCRGA